MLGWFEAYAETGFLLHACETDLQSTCKPSAIMRYLMVWCDIAGQL